MELVNYDMLQGYVSILSSDAIWCVVSLSFTPFEEQDMECVKFGVHQTIWGTICLVTYANQIVLKTKFWKFQLNKSSFIH